jgi:hypothetical protein
MKKAEAEKILDKRNRDKLYDVYGPSKLGERTIWEGIVQDADNEWQGRYILTGPDKKSYEIYEDFQALMLEVGALYNAATQNRLRERMMTLMPAVTLGVAILVCAYLVMFKDSYSAWAAAFMFFCIIASACVLYFGTFRTPKIPGTPI